MTDVTGLSPPHKNLMSSTPTLPSPVAPLCKLPCERPVPTLLILSKNTESVLLTIQEK